MTERDLSPPMRELAWSLWTELGVPGGVRNHRNVALDIEPLIVISPLLFEHDPRLRDQCLLWCAAHSSRVSLSRLRGLLRRSNALAREAFEPFSATLRLHAGLRWPLGDTGEAWPRMPDGQPPRLPLARPALLQLRLRALCGVGARADVLRALLAHEARWIRVSDLNEEGYSKRNVALILSELAAAGFADSHLDGNAQRFRLSRPGAVSTLAQADELTFPRWAVITELLLVAVQLSALASRSASVRRVKANTLRDRLKPIADQLALTPPPVTRGVAETWELTLKWTHLQLSELAAGRSPALQLSPPPRQRLPEVS